MPSTRQRVPSTPGSSVPPAAATKPVGLSSIAIPLPPVMCLCRRSTLQHGPLPGPFWCIQQHGQKPRTKADEQGRQPPPGHMARALPPDGSWHQLFYPPLLCTGAHCWIQRRIRPPSSIGPATHWPQRLNLPGAFSSPASPGRRSRPTRTVSAAMGFQQQQSPVGSPGPAHRVRQTRRRTAELLLLSLAAIATLAWLPRQGRAIDRRVELHSAPRRRRRLGRPLV